jgi:hypothetical protein
VRRGLVVWLQDGGVMKDSPTCLRGWLGIPRPFSSECRNAYTSLCKVLNLWTDYNKSHA